MVEERYIDGKIWEDLEFRKLDKFEKIVFLYLLTNQYAEGPRYKISDKDIIFEIGYNRKILAEALAGLITSGFISCEPQEYITIHKWFVTQEMWNEQQKFLAEENGEEE